MRRFLLSDDSTKARDFNWSAGAGGRIAGALGRDMEGQWANVGDDAPTSGDARASGPRGGIRDLPTRDDLPRTKQEKAAAVAALRSAMEHMTAEQQAVLERYLQRAASMRKKWARWRSMIDPRS